MPYTQFAREIGEADLPRLHVRPENFQYLPFVVFYGPRGHLPLLGDFKIGHASI
jgi:hypothetical protein